MLRALIRLHATYTSFFEEVRTIDDFQRIIEEVEVLQDLDTDFITKLLKVGELYAKIDRFCNKHRKHVPPTVLSCLKADLTDIIEATPLT